MRPYSEASERNKDPILSVLRPYLEQVRAVLEIGSGTGQHAVHLAGAMPRLTWYSSDLLDNHAGIHAWIRDSGLANVRSPLVLDVCDDEWPALKYGAVFSANTAHIMGWREVCCMFAGVAGILEPAGPFLLYGPFSEHGVHNSESNRTFDDSLRRRAPQMGIRDIEALKELGDVHGLSFQREHEMPANNRILVWARDVSHHPV